MSFRTVDLCTVILDDHFGHYVALCGGVLLRQQLSLGLLARQLAKRISGRELRRSIAILEQHNLLAVEPVSREVLYSVLPNRVLQLVRAPWAILIVKTLYSGAAEAIFEDILAHGQTSCSECIRRVSQCLDNLSVEKVKFDFVRLAEAQILIRCDQLDESAEDIGCPVFVPEPDPYLMPDVILDAKDDDGSVQKSPNNGSRKRKANDAEFEGGGDSDSHILWHINWTRMERFFRDELILNAVDNNELLDSQALRVAQLLLKVGEVKSDINSSQSNPISLQDVVRYAKEHEVELSREEMDEKLQIIGKDTNSIVRRVGDSGGGLYIINYEKGIEFLCNEHIESAIREKIGDKAVRIYRLLRSRGFLEEEQLEKEAMLSSKETKEFCCALMDASFITNRQLARANDFAPARTFFLYTVSLLHVLSTAINFTTMALNNVIRRRMLERERHEVLLDRQLKMEVILSNIANDTNFDEESRKQQMEEVEQAYMAESDRRVLERFRRAERRFFVTEIELDKVLFTLQQYKQLRERWQSQQQSGQGRRRRQQTQQPQPLAFS